MYNCVCFEKLATYKFYKGVVLGTSGPSGKAKGGSGK